MRNLIPRFDLSAALVIVFAFTVPFFVAGEAFAHATPTTYEPGASSLSERVPELGIRNIYVLTFFLAVLGGVSAFTAAGYYSTLFALALGGANPFVLALLSAPGVLIGDLVFWYLGRAGRPIAEAVLSKPLQSILRFTERQPRPLIPIFAYIYTGLTPLPGDLLMISLAVIGYPLRKILIPILLGNFTLALIVSLSAVYGVTFARSLF